METRTRRYRYRAYPTEGQARAAARLFGCVRLVHNRFIAERDRLHKAGLHRQVKMNDTAKKVTTDLKRQPGFEFLQDVSSTPLQQAVRQAQKAHGNWFASITGKRRGPKVSKPRFKKRTHRQAAEFTRSARFKVRTEPGCKWGRVTLPKIGNIKFACPARCRQTRRQ